jgi:hypothetical protein
MGLTALIVVRRDSRALTNTALAGGTAIVVAGPWWYASREPLYDYLFRYGYGERATDFGGSNLAIRAVNRSVTLLGDIRIPFLLLAAATVAAVVADARRHRRSGRALCEWPVARRDLGAAVLAARTFGHTPGDGSLSAVTGAARDIHPCPRDLLLPSGPVQLRRWGGRGLQWR